MYVCIIELYMANASLSLQVKIDFTNITKGLTSIKNCFQAVVDWKRLSASRL